MARSVFQQGINPDSLFAKIACFEINGFKTARFAVVTVQTLPVCTDPNSPAAVFAERCDDASDLRTGIVRVGLQGLKAPLTGSPSADPAAIRRNPQHPGSVFQNRVYPIVGQTVRIERIVGKQFKPTLRRIISVQARPKSTNPNNALPIFHRSDGQPMRGMGILVEMPETPGRFVKHHHSMFRRQPQLARAVFYDRMNFPAGPIPSHVARPKNLVLRIKFVQGRVGPHPYGHPQAVVALPVFAKFSDNRMLQKIGRCPLWIVAGKLFCLAVEQIQAAARGADPELPAPILVHKIDHAVAEALRVIQLGKVGGKGFVQWIESAQAHGSAYPQHPLSVFMQSRDNVARQTGRIAREVPKSFDAVTIIAVQTAHSTDPNETLAILAN